MSAMDTARAAWGVDCPVWILALAKECDETSQNRTAKRLGRSASFVSNILRNQYNAELSAAEEVVRGALMNETVICPVLGEIGKQVCLQWRRRSRTFENVNSQYVRMYRACRDCERNKGAEG